MAHLKSSWKKGAYPLKTLGGGVRQTSMPPCSGEPDLDTSFEQKSRVRVPRIFLKISEKN